MLSSEDITKLETDYKRIAVVTAAEGEWQVVYQKPSRAQYKRFRSQINNVDLAPDATELLARQLVVYPSREAFDALLEEWPGIAEASSKALLHLSGMASAPDVK